MLIKNNIWFQILKQHTIVISVEERFKYNHELFLDKAITIQ